MKGVEVIRSFSWALRWQLNEFNFFFCLLWPHFSCLDKLPNELGALAIASRFLTLEHIVTKVTKRFCEQKKVKNKKRSSLELSRPNTAGPSGGSKNILSGGKVVRVQSVLGTGLVVFHLPSSLLACFSNSLQHWRKRQKPRLVTFFLDVCAELVRCIKNLSEWSQLHRTKI